jgi:hypothetical protein
MIWLGMTHRAMGFRPELSGCMCSSRGWGFLLDDIAEDSGMFAGKEFLMVT